MASFTDLFVDRARDERRALQAQQQMQQQGAQQIFEQVQGSPGQQAQAAGGGALREIAPTPGLGALPVGDQAAAFASIVSQTPGFEEEGLSMFSTALQNRAQRLQQESQFQQTDQRLSGQADAKLIQEQNQWTAEHELRQAKRLEEAEMQALKMMLTKEQITAAQTSAESAAESMRIAQAKFQRLTPADQALVETSTTNLFSMQENINLFEDTFAVNTLIPGKGQLELNVLAHKNDKSPAELSKLKFWTDVQEYEQYFGKALSGAEISDSQREQIRNLIPNVRDDAGTIRQKMLGLHRETERILKGIQSRLTQEGFRDISSQFQAGLELTPSLGPVEPPLPPGFTRVP